MIELAFTCVNLGHAGYEKFGDECERTARLVGFDHVTRFTERFDRNSFSLRRVECLKDYARHANGDLVQTDCDMKWLKSPAPLFDEAFDIGLCWRSGHPAMPYYAGFVLVRHGSEAAVNFLTEWWFTIATMPKELQGWWGDQLALASMLGRGEPNTTKDFMGAKVRLFDAGRVFFNMQSKDQMQPAGVFATHFKGDKKDLAA